MITLKKNSKDFDERISNLRKKVMQNAITLRKNTRVQEAKRRYIDSYHKIETDDRKLELDLIRLEMEAARDDSSNTEDMKDDSLIKALNDSAEGAWNDYTEEE